MLLSRVHPPCCIPGRAPVSDVTMALLVNEKHLLKLPFSPYRAAQRCLDDLSDFSAWAPCSHTCPFSSIYSASHERKTGIVVARLFFVLFVWSCFCFKIIKTSKRYYMSGHYLSFIPAFTSTKIKTELWLWFWELSKKFMAWTRNDVCVNREPACSSQPCSGR